MTICFVGDLYLFHQPFSSIRDFDFAIFAISCRYMYDSVVESSTYQVFDSKKQLYSFGDVYAEEKELPKGDYTIHLMIRHDDTKILEKLKNLPMIVERKLKDKDVISVSVYATNSDAVKEEKALKDPINLYKGEQYSKLTVIILKREATMGRMTIILFETACHSFVV